MRKFAQSRKPLITQETGEKVNQIFMSSASFFRRRQRAVVWQIFAMNLAVKYAVTVLSVPLIYLVRGDPAPRASA